MSEKTKVLAVVGPTASGKTALAIELAKRFNGEVVSCDSMQIYKGMEIASAAPDENEMQGIVHHLIGFVSPNTKFSVSRYCDYAKKCITDIASRGKLPILCGGTGLYYSSLADGLTFVDAPADEKLRSELYQRAEKEGGEVLLRELARFDPETAARLHPNQIPRIVRAIEIYRESGLTITQQNELSRQGGCTLDMLVIGLNYKDRSVLYDRVNRRVDIMIQNGLVDEARKALEQYKGTSVQAIGHKELAGYIEGTVSLEECAEKLKQQTRRYAKRQLTWFRRDERIHWIDIDETDSWQYTIQRAVDIINSGLENG